MTELLWDGKYDAQGRRVAPPRIALPFQTVETVNESAADRARNLDLFAGGGAAPAWRNRLVWGDKKYVLPSLLGEFAGKVNLVYIDPPFATGGDFSYTATVPDGPDGGDGGTFVKQPSVIEQKAYRDTWGRGLDGYLKWFYETVAMLRDLLAEDGSMYVHLDWHVAHYAKCLLDDLFGPDRFQNEIVWQRTDPHNDARKRFGNVHDVIFWYSKGERPQYHPNSVRTEISPAALAEYSLLELDNGEVLNYAGNEPLAGRRFKLENATWKGSNPKKKFVWRGVSPSDKREWIYDLAGMERALAAGELYLRDPNKGSTRCKKLFLDTNQGTLLQSIWTDVGRMKGGSRYATEKPELLLDRILRASSQKDDLVLDCFCGSGTTAAVAEKLGRRWITCDLGRFAIHTTRKRLLGTSDVRPFVVQNLGKYERQAWQSAEFGATSEAQVAAYRQFILDLYRGRPVSGYQWLHGLKHGRMVHVGGVDAPVTMADVTSIVAEFRRATGTGKDAPTRAGVDVLGWDFAFELNEMAKQQAGAAGIDLKLVRIPREVLEPKAVEQGDIRFYELAALAVSAKTKGRQVTLELTDFVVNPDDVPADVQGAITHWEQWIDYWAVDWSNAGDAFHNEWQAYRTRKQKTLEKRTTHTYDAPGAYRIVVKVIDILGNDTTRVVDVEVR